MVVPKVAIFRSNSISPDPRVEKVARYLSTFTQVLVVGWDRFGDQPQSQQREGFSVQLFSHHASFGMGLRNSFNLARWIFFLLGWVLRKGKSIQVYHACDFDTVFPAFVGKFLFGARVVYDIFDFYADHVRNTPAWILRLIRYLDLWAVRRADVVILVDEVRIEQLKGIQPRQLEIIYNTPDDIGAALSQEKEKKEGLRIAYIGILQIERGLLELIEVLRNHPQWSLDLAGFGSDESLILEKARLVPGIVWHGRVDYPRALQISSGSDVLIATYDPGIPNHRYASPNKIFEAMMLGKPIIVAAGTHMDQIVQTWESGLIVPYGDIDALESALTSLTNNPALCRQLGLNSRKAYEQKYSWDIMEKRLAGIYSRLIKI